MDRYIKQYYILKNIVEKQKALISSDEFSKKLTFVLSDSNAEYYQKKLAELSKMISISEILIISKGFHRALNYICLSKYTIKEIENHLEDDFKKIKEKML